MILRWSTLRTLAPSALVDPSGASAAVIHSCAMLAEEQRRSGRTGEVTTRLRELQERNHFADLLESAMRPRGNHGGT